MARHFSRSMGGRTIILVGLGLVAVVAGCVHSPIDLSKGPAPWRIPRPGPDEPTYEDSLTGGEVFSMYCNQCHNARALGERPFANYQNVAAHMRVRANFTGKEYEKLLAFLRRWHDVPDPSPTFEPSPKRLIPPQPINELREEITAPPTAQPAGGAGAGEMNPAGAPNAAAADQPPLSNPPPPLEPLPTPVPGRS
jgi:hypothetical protein